MDFDFSIFGSGTVYMLMPLSDAAKIYADDHFPEDTLMLGNGIAVEHGYIHSVSKGILDDGFSITKDSMEMYLSESGELCLREPEEAAV